MGRRTTFGLTLLAAVIAAATPPLLALQESRRQAYQTEADFALGYARDVQRRVDETGRQAMVGMQQLASLGDRPCSPRSLELMRHIDLASTYLQAIGRVEGDTLVCSSIDTTARPLGQQWFQSSAGVVFYTSIPSWETISHRLIGIRRGDFIVLVHRELPLDTWTSVPDVSLAVMHREAPAGARLIAMRGTIELEWLDRLGTGRETTFIAGQHLVAAVRSQRWMTASIAAVPLKYLEQRTAAIAGRLVPAGMVAGLALAVSILLLARRQMSIATAVRQGLRRHEFFLLYQPIVDLATGNWVGAEALLRWRRPTGELIGPDLFVPIAEQTGSVTRLTEEALRLVRHDVGDFLALYPDFHIAINLSARDMETSVIVGLLKDLLQTTHAAPSNLLVEITERAFLNLESARQVIGAIRELGVAVAIDDFGTGYSSLSYIDALELDFLKIDRSFTEAIGTRAPTNQVVDHIISMAHTLGLRMIAEGVETEAQAQFLVRHKVQHGQGWLYGKPLPFNELRQAYKEQLHRAAQEPEPRKAS